MARRLPSSACQSGKVEYRDRLAALLAMSAMGGSRDETRTYRCPHCTSWHLTSKPAYRKPAILPPRGGPKKKVYERPDLGETGPI